MEKRLSSSQIMSATHAELERYVVEERRKLQPLLLQAHLELRATQERAVPVSRADE